MRRSVLALLACLLVMAPLVACGSATARTTGAGSSGRASSGLPSKKVWLADVGKAMAGSQAYLKQRVAARKKGEKLAINLDIDNTSLETKYSPYDPIPVVLRFTRYAHSRGIKVFFNTGRGSDTADMIKGKLLQAGFTVDGFCHRRDGEQLVHGKKRCRASFAAAGYTLVANVGNNDTDFVGTGYERAFRLPNYGKKLG